MITSKKNTIRLSYDHLVLRLEEYSTYPQQKYLHTLQRLVLIPGMSGTPEYKSYFDLLCRYQQIQTEIHLVEEYLDQATSLFEEVFYLEDKSK